jgi:hypothetical protein
MNIVIHCPHCEAQLSVAPQASGKTGRCPHCHAHFQVPAAPTLIDDTITCWLEGPKTPDDAENDALPAPPSGNLIAKLERAKREAAAAKAKREAEAAAQARRLHQATGHYYPRRLFHAPPPPDPHADPQPAAPEKPAHEPSPVAQAAASTATLAIPDVPPVMAPHTHPSHHPVTAHHPVTTTIPQAAPSRPHPLAEQGDGEVLRLEVIETGAAGVTLGFGAPPLNRASFRASMPLCCLACGDAQPQNLLARPLAWVDKTHGRFNSPGELERRYECHVRPHQTVREIAAAMRSIEEQLAPFSNPMPYFVCQACSSKVTINCQTYVTPRGVRCEVVIPNASYALAWLGRVNGVCGDDYSALESQVLRLEAEGWRAIPDAVRSRLAAWFEFKGAERFIAYYSDSDFAKKDAGLAGVILTDHRLVHCKFHHHGSLSLQDAEAQLHIAPDGPFFDLSCVSEKQRHRMVRLRADDCTHLLAHIAALEPLLQVVQG